MKRITTVPAAELTVEHLFLLVEIPHTHPGSTERHVMAGQLTGYHRSEIDVELFLDEHAPRRLVTVLPDTLVSVLNAPRPEITVAGFGS